MQRLGQQDLRIPHSFSDGVVLFLSSKRQLRERRLITGRVLDVDEVLVVRDAVVFRQLEQANESLEQGSPGDTGRVLVLHTCTRPRQCQSAPTPGGSAWRRAAHQSLVYSVSIMAGHSVRTFVMPTAQIFFSMVPETFWISGMIIFSNTMPNILREGERRLE